MQTTESKTTTPSLQFKTSQGSFFQAERTGQHWNQSDSAFFPYKGGGTSSFFSKPTLQTKCAECEQEEQAQ